MPRQAHLDDEKRPLDPQMFKRLFRYVLPYKHLLIGATIMMFAGVGISLVQPLLLRHAIDENIHNGDMLGLTKTALLYLGTFLAAWVASYCQSVWMALSGQRSLADLRRDLFSHLQRLSLSFFTKRKAGEIMSRVVNDVDTLSELLSSGIITVISDLVTLVFIAAIMFEMHPTLALVTFSILPVMFVVTIGFRGRMLQAHRQVRGKVAEINANLQESISGVKVTQAFNREKRSIQRFEETNQENMEANVRALDLFAVFMPILELIGVVGIALALWYGGTQVMQGTLTVGTLAAFISYIQRFFGPVRNISQIYTQLQSAGAAVERVFGIMDVEPEIKDSPKPVAIDGFKDKIVYENVSFAYNPDEPVLKNINLTINKGETIALVGPTGAGKTTMINLLCRFYDPTSGRITVDGRDLREIEQASWRKLVSIVLQDTFLFSATIKENIRFGKPDATDEEIRWAAEQVAALPFINELEHGFDTMLTERGSNLSVGQRQLLSLARALIGQPEILILDEATSSVDLHTEGLIQQALEVLLKDRTAVIIAHRLSTIENADRIVVIQDGEIAEIGNHRELLEKGGLYYQLHQKQFGAVMKAEGV
ncbi:MAG TPA: ABC transporter ATP-binding protein [Firmicutes bacterium]|nr:ABC transporter ATP-binding protein [Bacillota bacterium]